ncbi:MAG: hypothetical protein J2P31_05115 [Blastocatellia bacterium]|nr:hypothetical protein [Blastocatellia bacterium]
MKENGKDEIFHLIFALFALFALFAPSYKGYKGSKRAKGMIDFMPPNPICFFFLFLFPPKNQ